MAKSSKSYKDLLMEEAEKNPYDSKDLSYMAGSEDPIMTAEVERKRNQEKNRWNRVLQKVKGN